MCIRDRCLVLLFFNAADTTEAPVQGEEGPVNRTPTEQAPATVEPTPQAWLGVEMPAAREIGLTESRFKAGLRLRLAWDWPEPGISPGLLALAQPQPHWGKSDGQV